MSSEKITTRTRILDATWHLMERNNGQGVTMSNIAKEAGISRQALYLHFASRIELVIATVHYVDEVKGLNARLMQFQNATTGIEMLVACVDVWGNYIPEIYGLAKALLNTRDTDEATARAWDGCMGGLRDVCQQIIEALKRDEVLVPEWSQKEAIEMLWTLISIQNWEQLTVECGWTTDQYVEWLKIVLKRTFVVPTRQN